MTQIKLGKLIDKVKTHNLTGNKALVILDDEEVQSLNPNGADRVINLPEANLSIGFTYKIINAGMVNNLIVKDYNNITIAILSPSEIVSFTCDNISWRNSISDTGGTGGTGGTGNTGSTGDTGSTGRTGSIGVYDQTNQNYTGTRYLSTTTPSGGVDGDIWLQYI